MKRLSFLLILFFCFAGQAAGLNPDWAYVEKRLTGASFKPDFIKTLKSEYEHKNFAQVLELNVLLFLKKSDYHGPQVSQRAVRDVRSFMTTHRSTLNKARAEHGVSSSVVASLMWMESRYGSNLGQHHVASVFLHLLQAERAAVVKHLQQNASKFSGAKITDKIKWEISKRAKRKAEWALEELQALQTMNERDKTVLPQLRGSFAGAFGMPQFIPSSYVKWARTPDKGKSPNLTKPQDAIYSVSYYLRDNGWKQLRTRTHVKALLRYNNSYDYAHAILKLSQQADGPVMRKRGPSTAAK